MDPPPPKMPPKPKKPIAQWRPKFAKVPPWFYAAFLFGALMQVFLAGYGIENLGAQGMEYHRAFAHIIEIFPLLIIIFAFLGADWRAGVGGILLLAQFQAQYALLTATSPTVIALHALNGVLMIVVAGVYLLRRPMWTKRVMPAA